MENVSKNITKISEVIVPKYLQFYISLTKVFKKCKIKELKQNNTLSFLKLENGP